MRARVLVALIACAAVAVVATESEESVASLKASAEMSAMSEAQLRAHIEASRRAVVAAAAKTGAGACTPKNVKCPRTGAAPFANGYQKKGTYNGCGAAGSWLDDSILGGKFTPCCNNVCTHPAHSLRSQFALTPSFVVTAARLVLW